MNDITLRAIMLKPENFDLILDSVHDQAVKPTRDGLQEQYNEDARFEDAPRYFIPRYVNKGGYDFGTWTLPNEQHMNEYFEFDREKIKTQFVEITRK